MQDRIDTGDDRIQHESDPPPEGLTKTLLEFRSLAEQNGGWVHVQRARWDLDPTDADDADLVRLFAEAGLSAERPENWRLLLETFAHYRYAKKGRTPKLTENHATNLIREAYLVAKEADSQGRRISLPSICKKLCDGPKDYRVPAEYRDPQGPLHPKTLQNRLEASLSDWEDNKDLPHTKRNYEFVPHVYEEISMMVAHLRSLASR